MKKLVQDILILFQTVPSLDAEFSAWSLYPASKQNQIENIVDESKPPYKNAMCAMRDGWQVIQISELKKQTINDSYELGPFPFQITLSKFNELVTSKKR